MRIRLIINDKDYGVAFKNAIASADKDIYVEIGKKGIINDLGAETIIVTDVEPESVDKRLLNRTVFLTMNPQDSVDSREENQVFKVFKYNPVSRILSDIEEVDYILTGESGKIYSANSIIYAICSDLCSKNFDLAKTVARQIMFRRGGKILLISMRYINQYPEPNGTNNSKFSKLMYYLNCGRECSIEPYIYHDSYGISYLRLTDGLNPISKLDANETIALIRAFCNRGFETLLLDIGDCYNDTNVKILNRSDNVMFFVGNPSNHFEIGELIDEKQGKSKIKTFDINNTYQDLELKIDDYIKKRNNY